MYLASQEEGYFCIGNVYAKYSIPFANKPLIVTFSYLGNNAKRKDAIDGSHDPWGFRFVKSERLNVISFCCVGGNNWYTDSEFQNAVHDLGEEISKLGLEVIGYGGSMGGFGVSALSQPLGINRLLLFNPISTLNSSKAPFEYRFKNARDNLNWDCAYNDGAESISKGVVIYDPFFKVDTLHAERYKGLEKFKFPGVGHSIPKHLMAIGSLKWVFQSFVNGSLDKEKFSERIKRKRRYSHYYSWMLSDENFYATKKRREIIKKYRDANKLINGELRVIKNSDIDKIRNLALKHEDVSIAVSRDLMSLANQLRPNGPFIKRKLREYEKALKG